jgi:hypothetical protein
MDEIERLFSQDLTKLTNEQLKKLLNIKTDDNVLEMFTQTTTKLKPKDDNDLTAIFDDLIKAEHDDKARRNKHAIKKAAIHTVSSNVEVVSNIEKSAKDIVNTTINKNKISKAVGHDETTPRRQDYEGLIPTFIDLSQDVTPIETAAIRAVNYAVEEGYERERLRMFEKNAIEEKPIKNAAIHEVNYAVEKGYVNHYPRKQVGIENEYKGIENEYKGSKVICYANSVLQMLYSLPYYRTIISNDSLLPINKLFVNMNNTPDNFVSPEKIGDCPSNVYKFVNKMHSKINVIQEDANEYLQYLLENLQVDAVKFIEIIKKQCNNEKDIIYSQNSSNLSIPVVTQSGGSTINAYIKKYSNEDMGLNIPRIKEHKDGIKRLMRDNLDKTINGLLQLMKKNNIKNKTMENNLKNYHSEYIHNKDTWKDTAIINFLYLIKNNKIVLNQQTFKLYITFNKLLYNEINRIESKDETEFIDGCIKYTDRESPGDNEIGIITYEKIFNNIDGFKEYVSDSNDYLAVFKKTIIKFEIPPENRYIFIQLKRFEFNDGKTNKLTDEVVPDKTLSIDGITYTLSGVIFHIGTDSNSGHYMYIQCDQYGKYHILYDDDIVYNYMENASKNEYHEYGGEFINENFINNNGYLFSYSRYPVDQDVNKKQKEADAAEAKKKQDEANAAEAKKKQDAANAAKAKKKQDEEALLKNKREEAKKKLDEEVLLKNKLDEEAKKKEIKEREAECKKTYYDCLGVPRNATKSDIKKAFYKLSKQIHPDKIYQQRKYSDEVIEECNKAFQTINNAYEVLYDEDKKKKYDNTLDAQEAKKKAAEKYAKRWSVFTKMAKLFQKK